MSVVATALKMCHILMEKLPEIFTIYFRREGVVFEVEKLSQMSDKVATSSEAQSGIESGSPNPAVELHSWVKSTAIKFKEKYFGDDKKVA